MIEWHDIITILLAIISIVSLGVAAGQLIRGRTNDRDDDRDTLIGISQSMKNVEQKLERIEVKIDDHGSRISTLEARIYDVDKRLERVESRCDTHLTESVGGTD